MKANILLVDDDQPMCWLLHRIFKHYQVHYFHDGLSAMAWLSEGNLPDLIICDYKLPHMEGNNFIFELKKSGLYRDIPIIVLSGWTNELEIKKCIEAGASEYLFKPFDPQELESFVTSLLQRERHLLKLHID